jgi:hypothetical protein
MQVCPLKEKVEVLDLRKGKNQTNKTPQNYAELLRSTVRTKILSMNYEERKRNTC